MFSISENFIFERFSQIMRNMLPSIRYCFVKRLSFSLFIINIAAYLRIALPKILMFSSAEKTVKNKEIFPLVKVINVRLHKIQCLNYVYIHTLKTERKIKYFENGSKNVLVIQGNLNKYEV